MKRSFVLAVLVATAPAWAQVKYPRKVKEIKVDIVVQGATVAEGEAKMEAFMDEYRRRVDAAGGGSFRRI